MRIEAELLIPGRGEPISDGVVITEADTVAYAGPAADAPVSDEEATRVSYVMPGMWDCHSHFFGVETANLETDILVPPALAAARGVRDAASMLEAGFTSAREVGGIGVFINRAIEEGSAMGPRIYAAGSVLSQTGGHGDIHSLPLDIVARHELSAICDGVDECLRAVRTQLRVGAELIKICASGGVMSEFDDPRHQQFSDEELTAIVEEAARAERIVAAHCHGKAGIMAAIRAGAKTIEHGTWLDQEAAEAMIEADAILVPTRFIVEDLLERKDEMPPYAYDKLAAISEIHKGAVQTAVEAGVKIALGTDIFVTGASYGRNGLEVNHLVQAGMSPLLAIESATANGPETLGPRAPKSGILAAGYDADIIAVASNPLDQPLVLADAANVTHVWKAGELVKSA